MKIRPSSGNICRISNLSRNVKLNGSEASLSKGRCGWSQCLKKLLPLYVRAWTWRPCIPWSLADISLIQHSALSLLNTFWSAFNTCPGSPICNGDQWHILSSFWHLSSSLLLPDLLTWDINSILIRGTLLCFCFTSSSLLSDTGFFSPTSAVL